MLSSESSQACCIEEFIKPCLRAAFFRNARLLCGAVAQPLGLFARLTTQLLLCRMRRNNLGLELKLLEKSLGMHAGEFLLGAAKEPLRMSRVCRQDGTHLLMAALKFLPECFLLASQETEFYRGQVSFKGAHGEQTALPAFTLGHTSASTQANASRLSAEEKRAEADC